MVYGWLYAQIDQPDKIADWLKGGFEESDLNSLVLGLKVLVRARYHFAKKRYPAALASRGNKYSVFTFLQFILHFSQAPSSIASRIHLTKPGTASRLPDTVSTSFNMISMMFLCSAEILNASRAAFLIRSGLKS
jgi:hypothetical protein